MPRSEHQRYTKMLVQNFSIDPDMYGNIRKMLKTTFKFMVALQSKGHLSNSCLKLMKPWSQNGSNPFNFLCKFVSKNLSTLVRKAPLNECTKIKYFVLVNKVIKMSESVKKGYKDANILS